MYLDLLKIFIPTTLAFFWAIFLTPFFTNFFFKYKMWKKKVRTVDTTSEEFKAIHARIEKEEVSVPCIGGSLIWVSVLSVIFLFYFLSLIFPNSIFYDLNFLSRSQTLIPIAVFFLGALLGLVDDLLEINGKTNITRSAKWYTQSKILAIILVSFIVACWFYFKIDMNSIYIPFYGDYYLGLLIIPLFIIVALATFSGGVIDGIDGLSGGVLASIFAAFTMIAFATNQLDLAALALTITGGILAFLWFNIPPARFYMGETGMMPLTLLIAVFAFLTNSVLVLPVIAMPLLLTSLSNIIQMLSKKLRKGKRVFKVAPIHHHFEAIGWPSYKITMRYWIFSIVFAILGVILFVIS